MATGEGVLALIRAEEEEEDLVAAREKSVLDRQLEGPTFEALEKRVQLETPTPDVDFDFGTMVNNVPSSAKQYAMDTTAIIREPGKTIEGMGDLLSGVGQHFMPDVVNSISELVTGEPMDPRNKDLAGVVGTHLADRYGTVNGLKKALMEDPVGIVSDVSMLFTGGLAASVKAAHLASRTTGHGLQLAKTLEAARNVVSKGDLYNAGVGLAKSNAAASVLKGIGKVPGLGWTPVPQGWGKKLYGNGLDIPNSVPRKDRQRIIDYGYDNRVHRSTKSYDDLQDRSDVLNGQVDDIVSGHKGTVEINDIYDPALAGKAHHSTTENTATPGADVAQIDRVIKDHYDATLDRQGPVIERPAVQAIKVAAGRKAAAGGVYGGGDQLPSAEIGAYADIQKGARQTLEAGTPDLAPINKELGTVMDMQRAIDGRLEGATLGMDFQKARVARAIGAPPGLSGAAGLVIDLFNKGQLEIGLFLKAMGNTGASWQTVRSALESVGYEADVMDKLSEVYPRVIPEDPH